ncbi:hypothetical protein [Apis mellifera associated microvirus 57]|nr:hypothetical protein [Apis mellifera associated microvirus 57]
MLIKITELKTKTKTMSSFNFSDLFIDKVRKDNNFTPAGDGKAVPQYYLDLKTLEIKKRMVEVEVIDKKTGEKTVKLEQATHSLYDDIQKFKDVNSIEKYQQMVNDGIVTPPTVPTGQEVDYTQTQDIERMYETLNKLNAVGVTPEQLIERYKAYLQDLGKKVPETNKTLNSAQENAQSKEINKTNLGENNENTK